MGRQIFQRRSEPEKDLLKITYTDGDHKLNFYINYPPPNYESLMSELHKRLFQDSKLPRCELRIYWIDEVSDEIDVCNNHDYCLFRLKYGGKDHLFVAPKAGKRKETNYPADCVKHEKKGEHADVSSEQPKTHGQPTTKQ